MGMPGTRAATEGPGCRAYAVYSHGQVKEVCVRAPRKDGEEEPKMGSLGASVGPGVEAPLSLSCLA